jgi:hypothetical protein
VFTVTDTLPNLFGNFKAITNPNAAVVIDTLSIVLTNVATVVVGSNSMGVDNIVLTR